MTPRALDHIALWVADRHAIADVCVARLGMHVIEETDRFTLIGSDARRGKLTLFAAEGPRERGALQHIGLRVSTLGDGEDEIDVGEGLVLRLIPGDDDLDHVALFSANPEQTAREYRTLGFAAAEPRDGIPRVRVADAFVEFHEGQPGDPDRPLLNHLAVLVDSVDDQIATANELGLEIADVVDAPNTYALFVWGPERVKLEYVEHKPSFSLT